MNCLKSLKFDLKNSGKFDGSLYGRSQNDISNLNLKDGSSSSSNIGILKGELSRNSKSFSRSSTASSAAALTRSAMKYQSSLSKAMSNLKYSKHSKFGQTNSMSNKNRSKLDMARNSQSKQRFSITSKFGNTNSMSKKNRSKLDIARNNQSKTATKNSKSSKKSDDLSKSLSKN